MNANTAIENLVWNAGLRKGLRPKTMKAYVYAVEKFLRIWHKEPQQVTKQDIEDYLLQLIRWQKAGSTVKLHFHALKFFYEAVMGKRLFVAIPCIRTRKRLPECLSQEEMIRFLAGIMNAKHRLLIIFTYGSGFRVSEVVSLRVKDLDLDAGFGWVRNGKGGKDRLFIIPDKLKSDIAEWIGENALRSEDWLFRGYKEEHYSESSVRAIVQQARQNAGISKNITPHTLRHSFATHLLENGYSLMEVNRLLGHSRMETTMVYTHMAKPTLTRVRSPYDSLTDPAIVRECAPHYDPGRVFVRELQSLNDFILGGVELNRCTASPQNI